MDNIFECIPQMLPSEVCEPLVEGGAVKIERIISRGHTSPEAGWYDQAQDEWVIVLRQWLFSQYLRFELQAYRIRLRNTPPL